MRQKGGRLTKQSLRVESRALYGPEGMVDFSTAASTTPYTHDKLGHLPHQVLATLGALEQAPIELDDW